MLAVLLATAVAAPVWPRQPTLHGDTVVFAAAGDLWTVSVAGGEARRLTALPGEESWPRLSPGGTEVAFSAELDGNVEVYVMPLSGGEPRRLTWHPGADRVLGWTEDGAVLFRSGRRDHSGFGEVFRVDPATGGPVPLETGRAEGIGVEPGGRRVVVADGDVEWFAWKRYRGGMASRLRVGVPGGPLPRISDAPARHPMWREDRLWYVDVDDQLASMDLGGLDVRTYGPAREPSMAPDGRIVFTNDGSIEVFDPTPATTLPVSVVVPVTLPASVGPPADPVPLAGAVESATAAGDRVVVVARGQVHVYGPTGWRIWAATPGVRYGPVGVAGDTVWARADDGRASWLVSGPLDGPPRRRRGAEGDGWIALAPSPDGAWVAGVHQDGRVQLVPARKGPARDLGRSPVGEPPTDLAWRPDSSVLAFTLADAGGQRTVFLAAPDGAPRAATSLRTDDHGPAWSADGATLAFTAERAPTIAMDHRDVAYVATAAAVAMAVPVAADGTPGRARLASAPAESAAAPLDGLPETALTIDRRAEWRQLVGEACRQVRDLYWDPDLGGVDWGVACDVARARVSRISTRAELNDVLGALIGELSAAHAFAFGGALPVPPDGPRPASLGADLRWDGTAWVVGDLLVPDDTMPTAAPLADAGVQAGECLLAIDGRPLDATTPAGRLVLDKGDQEVTLTVGPCGGPTREVGVRPLPSDKALRTADLVRRRAAAVEAASNGRVGYVLMPDVNDLGIIAFEQMWAGQRDREGLVLDLRHNGGGWYSDVVVDRLSRRSGARFQWRHADQTWPIRSGPARIVVLVDGGTASEGEILARGLQLRGAVVVGEATWGGLSGDHAGRPLADGGEVRTPGVLWRDPELGPALEGVGLRPDVPVADPRDPARDPALDRAVKVALGGGR